MREVIYTDRNEALQELELGNHVLEWCSDELRGDKELVMLQMQWDGVEQFETVLAFASEDLCADKEVVLAALKWDGYAIRYASDALKNDRDVAMAAVQNDIYGEAFECIGEALQADQEIILEGLNCNQSIFDLLPKAIQEDAVVQFVLNLVKARSLLNFDLQGDDDDDEKINQMNAIHAREWLAIKQALSEKPDVLLSLYGDTSLAGQNFYTTVRDSVLNQGEIESQPLPMLE
ncbi:MAG: hypothetical protein C0466_13620 [Candidatus Accumulibacter sp.]|nr:hypothetical protein [Accumulibacter sp.]